jgi:hypothetical protein
MKLSAVEARRCAEEMLEACPALSKLDLGEVALAVIRAVGSNLKDLEREVAEAGAFTPEVVGAYLCIGATWEVLQGFAEGDDRRVLGEAGRAVGRLLLRKWGEKISEELAAREGGN